MLYSKKFQQRVSAKNVQFTKKRHFVKHFVICNTDGYIVDIYGLYEATLNDAAILLNILEKDIELGKLIKQNYFLIVDRGFRDCVDVLEKKYNLMV